MRFTATLFILFLSSVFGLAQDGSDIRYLKTSGLSKMHIGKFAHFDFGSRSFGISRTKRPGDKISIEIDKKEIVFTEHRQDDGYNNWFYAQYLESVDPINGMKLRITKNKILDVSSESIKVESYFDFFDSKEQIIEGKSFTRNLCFAKDQIVEVLIKAQ